uniref:Tash1 protein, putative n=2 Tax=Theileria parva TaxID=5875 RepID=Q4N856_THEPA|eukprot:XP_766135.1 hypothetical protein [Theileria parva strain Muguga]
MSEFHTLKIVGNGIIKTTIFSTPDRPITKICKGCRGIWQALPGESAKCVTYITSELSKKILMIIEVDNPVKHQVYYLNRCRTHYVYITREQFEKEFVEISYPPSGKVPIPKLKRPEPITEALPVTYEDNNPNKLRKLMKKPETAETTIGNREKSSQTLMQTQVVETQLQPDLLEPEIVQVEVESEDDEEGREVQQLQPSFYNDSELLNEPLFEEDVEKLLESELEDIGLSESELDSLFDDTSEQQNYENESEKSSND